MARKRVPVKEILHRLSQMYPDAKCALDHRNAFELLIATILSAQCTDARVNIVTGRIFPTYNRPEHFAALSPEEIGEMIRDCGLWQSKARNIHKTCQILVDRYGGEVPSTMEELVQLPGVGRKTANVVLSNAFGVPAIAVDTHVLRVSNRLGLADAKTPEETEQQLMQRIPREQWSQAHHWLIYHGRQVCHARKPACSECALVDLCRYAQESVPPGHGTGERRVEQTGDGNAVANSSVDSSAKGDGRTMIRVGGEAPDFTLESTQGTFRLSALRGEKAVVLIFYPRDNTPGCSRQLSAAQAALAEYEAHGAQVAAVNPGSLASHEKWACKAGFSFPICADTGKKVAEAYGVVKPNGGIQRTVFVVDRQGRVAWAKEGMPSTEEILAAVDAAVQG